MPNSAYNTIASWSNKGKDIVYQGEMYYWSKDCEFMKIIDLPRRRPAAFELATDSNDELQRLLNRHGWRHIDSIYQDLRKIPDLVLPIGQGGHCPPYIWKFCVSPVYISSDLTRYRRYIQAARGEFTVAKDQNIRLRSGWFSDRSVCYLAAGRPMATQDTGFGQALPTGKGLYAWKTLADIATPLDQIESDYEGNCRAAREIVEQYLAADKVLDSLMTRAGL